MTLELILQFEAVARPAVELDDVVSGHSEGLPVCGERVICDWVVEEVMNFRSGHLVAERYDRRSSLLSSMFS